MIEVFHNVISKDECNEIISLFDNSSQSITGRVAGGYKPETKQSTDLPCKFLNSYDNTRINDIICLPLYRKINEYASKFPYLNGLRDQWEIDSNYNIQKYEDGQGYFKLHCETDGKGTYNRILAWMIYLNDAQCGTEFPEQNTITQAIEGDCVIWPAYWTHPHKGVTPNIGNKYIATGWCIFK